MHSQPPLWVLPYIGVPFVDRGRDPDIGLDCWGLVRLVMADRAGILLDSLQVSESDYRAVTNEIVLAQQSYEWTAVKAGEERELDVAEMTWPVKVEGQWRHEPLHVGIVVYPGWLLHIERSTASMLSPYLSDQRVGRRIIGYWRHRRLLARAF